MAENTNPRMLSTIFLIAEKHGILQTHRELQKLLDITEEKTTEDTTETTLIVWSTTAIQRTQDILRITETIVKTLLETYQVLQTEHSYKVAWYLKDTNTRNQHTIRMPE